MNIINKACINTVHDYCQRERSARRRLADKMRRNIGIRGTIDGSLSILCKHIVGLGLFGAQAPNIGQRRSPLTLLDRHIWDNIRFVFQ